MEEQQLIFITGGARSGKSSFAEEYAATLAQKERKKLYYLATSRKTDDEMVQRIKRHQNDRNVSGLEWETIECPMGLVNKVNHFQSNSVVLLDCLTILLSNELFQNGFDEEYWNDETIENEVMNSIMAGIDALLSHVDVLIIVSNEVVYDPITMDQSLVQTYQKLLGWLHQKIVQKAVKAYTVEVGVPLLMKEDGS